MKYYLLFVILTLRSFTSSGQKIGRHPPKIYVENYSALSNDGTIFFEIDVRMSDCLSHIEIKDITKVKTKRTFWDWLHDFWWFKILRIYDFEISKVYSKELDVDNYYLKEDEIESIYMKTELLSIKSIFGRKDKMKLLVNLYSHSGKVVYTKEFVLYKDKLIPISN
jgi:hypothetical protein